MLSYAHDIEMKRNVDGLQVKLKCCGNHNYNDWFMIPWIKTYIGGLKYNKEKKMVSDEVPFSCCSPGGAKGPCIHHGVLTKSPIYKYDAPDRQHYLNQEGCTEVLTRRIRSSFARTNTICFLMAFLLFILCICERFVQTAHSVKKNLFTDQENAKNVVCWIIGKKILKPYKTQHELYDSP
ncbi:peripherin-2-like [Ctenocephalides felis]|uniref:peripherin-2-like n=1 Tax=Ctenocephalides felis TaxID=7515 RepID=UPI000E6E3811|nr:peripherin-2-like [Ctenocephalides felis]XP_026476192.1 peripherin-2-like [Ctenocephalides felis]